ncbi:MAG: tRNA (adenine(22)-N(1))-methyltransferase TrmK [archaeon]|nr:tRNA (adenine(22)-N(1))-methyltransferase TrmK [archaeon]
MNNKRLRFKKISKKQQQEIEDIRNQILSKLRMTPKNGQIVEYLGKQFIVFQNVFWPHEDSKPLVQNFVIKKEDSVLDVGTGSGVIAIFAAYAGAKKVLAVDINPDAIKNAKKNIERHKFSKIIKIRKSNVFSTIKANEKFDVITMNPPFSNRQAKDLVDSTIKDDGFKVHENFFKHVRKHLKENGRIYLAQANFGGVNEMIKLAEKNSFRIKLIGEKKMPNDCRIFYAFELSKK